MDDRENELGFKPQKECVYNKLLPYKDQIDDESNIVLAEIKSNLGRSVQLRDIKIGASHWVGQLSRYIRLYGMKFSKEDHLVFVHLMYELITMPDLELSVVSKFSSQLVSLLKKRELISRDDLTLHWRPIYNLVESVLYSQSEQHGLQLFPSNIESVLKSLVRSCRTYFPVSSTQEMLDEWRPLLCPYDVTIIKGLNYLELFLPTIRTSKEEMDKGFRLWFDELMKMLESFQNNPSWEACLVSLMSRLAHDNVGHIDWSPYVSMIFNRLLRSFNLPVGTQSVKVGRAGNSYEVHSVVIWIVSMMGNDTLVQEHVTKLFKTLQTFYHPSNLGKWNIKLSGLMMEFPKVFITRIHRERYKKPTWQNPIPESHKLSDADITAFVESMKNTVFTSMFSKYGSQDSAIALRHLSNMRPEIIVPPLLERMYPAMETLIEPHRLIACMNCVVSVARSMLNTGKWFPEGPSHLLPLLNSSLPGIDPNDFKKCLVTFQMISTFVALVPIVDCSDAINVRTDLTENERELCSATSQFEDFVLQFVDRVFILIENSAQEHVHMEQVRLNPEQTMLEIGLASTFTSVLQQCSNNIYQSALRRLHSFVTSSVYETRVGGRFAANLVRAAAKVKPKVAVDKFINTFCDNILNHIKNHEEVMVEEQLDNSFMWNLLMLSQLVRCDGTALVPHQDRLIEVLSYTLRLKCVEAYEISGQLLRYILRALVLVYPKDYRSASVSFDTPLSEYLPIRDWAQHGDIDNLKMDWHIPGEDEMKMATKILEHFLQPELDTVKKQSKDNMLPREDLLRRLNLILECLLGAGSLLPMWAGPAIQIVESAVELKRFFCVGTVSSVGEIKLGGMNTREAVVGAIRPLLKHMLSECEDDTKGLFRLLRVYETILFFHGVPKNDFEARWKSFHLVKRAFADKMRGSKRHIRALLVDRVQLQNELRSLNSSNRSFTELHKELVQDLFELSISHYSEVRKKAQAVLVFTSHTYPFSYRCLLDQIVYNLKDKDVPEHNFKGALYLLQGQSKRSLMVKRSWEVMGKLWPAFVQAQRSEKPSILRVIEENINKTVQNVETTAIKIETNEACIAIASKLFEDRKPSTVFPTATKQELEDGAKREKEVNKQNEQMYVTLVEDLVKLVKEGNLTWKFCIIGLELISLLVRNDVPIPTSCIQLFVESSIHDSLYIRKLSMSSLSAVLKQQKRVHKKIHVDPYTIPENTAPPAPAGVVQPGLRPDNMWHQYSSTNKPDTQEKWENLTVVEKTHWGYYCWSQKLEIYAPKSEQPKLNRDRVELSEGEQIIYDVFNNTDHVSKMLDFLALEENKGRDKYNKKHVVFFKGLFRNYGNTFLPLLSKHVERLVSDTSFDKHDSNQRCGMEILAGALCGSKHWHYTEMKALWDWALPLLRTVLNNLTIATIEDWGKFFSNVSESRDPRKIYWYYDLVMDNPLSGEGGSTGDMARLYMIQHAMRQQEWRVTDLHTQLYQYLSPHLAHPYKNVRERIASLLSDIFMYDYKMFPTSVAPQPLRKDFIEGVLPQLDKLKDVIIEEATLRNGSELKNGETTLQTMSEKPVVHVSLTDVASGAVQLPKAIAMKLAATGQLPTLSAGELSALAATGQIPALDGTGLLQAVQSMAVSEQEDHTEGSEERKNLIRLCKTVTKFLSNCIDRSFNSAPEEFFKILPVMCTLESEAKDEELKQDCSMSLACLSQASLQPEVIPIALATVRKIIGLASWHSRAAVLGYVQVMVFCNFFTLNQPEYIKEVKEIILHLLCDEQLEVREMASITLSGLMHCGYLEMDKDMLDHFERLSHIKLKKRQKLENLSLEKMIQRHAGVLGLSAYVQAYPYEVPEFMPQILMDLSDHVNDPQPIQMSVKKTLSNFRRTHHDNWHDHKLMFTDDQLVILTDMLVSPNYYA